MLTTVSVLGFKVLRTGSKLGCSLKKKKKRKKGLHLESVSEIPIFVPKSWCSLRLKTTALNKHLQQIETVTNKHRDIEIHRLRKVKTGFAKRAEIPSAIPLNPITACTPRPTFRFLKGYIIMCENVLI